jgi:hypothetical protein
VLRCAILLVGGADRAHFQDLLACREVIRMKRREFVTLVGGTAMAWPLAAHGQQPERMRRIGVLLPAAVEDLEFQAGVAYRFRAIQERATEI